MGAFTGRMRAENPGKSMGLGIRDKERHRAAKRPERRYGAGVPIGTLNGPVLFLIPYPLSL